MLKSFKTLLHGAVMATLVVCSTSVVYAGSYGAYGGGGEPSTNCLAIDQMVSNPAVTKSIEYIDNILPQGAKYKPNQAFYARVKVKNTGAVVATHVQVTNEIPECFSYIGGPGVLNKGGNVLTIDAGDLQPQEEKVFYITYKVGDVTCFPNKPIYCATNKMSVNADVCSEAQDMAQLCVEPQVLGLSKGGVPITVTETPDSGPEYGLLFLVGQGALTTLGIYLKRRAQ